MASVVTSNFQNFQDLNLESIAAPNLDMVPASVVRNEKELTSKMIATALQEKATFLTPSDLKKIILANHLPEVQTINLLGVMSQFGNTSGLEFIFNELKPFLKADYRLVTHTQDLASVLRYFDSKGAFKDHKSASHPEYFVDDIADKDIVIVDQVYLKEMQKSSSLCRHLSRHHVKLCIPLSFESGVNYANIASHEALTVKLLQEIDKREITISTSYEQVIHQYITSEKAKFREQFEMLERNFRLPSASLTSRMVWIQRPRAKYSCEQVCKQINGRSSANALNIDQVVQNFQEPALREVARELIVQNFRSFSSRDLASICVDLHQHFQVIASKRNIEPENVLYVVANPAKSFSFVQHIFQQVNKISSERIFSAMELKKFEGQINSDKMFVVLDDMAGSGFSLLLFYQDLKTIVGDAQIVLSPLVCAAPARALFKTLTRESEKTLTFKPGIVVKSFEESDFYMKLSLDQKRHAEWVAGDLGYRYTGLMIAFPYGSPNNNNDLGSAVARLFTINGCGIKGAKVKQLLTGMWNSSTYEKGATVVDKFVGDLRPELVERPSASVVGYKEIRILSGVFRYLSVEVQSLTTAANLKLSCAPKVMLFKDFADSEISFLITKIPGLKEARLLPLSEVERISVKSLIKFSSEMNSLADMGYTHPLVNRSGEHVFIHPQSGDLIITRWPYLHRGTSPEIYEFRQIVASVVATLEDLIPEGESRLKKTNQPQVKAFQMLMEAGEIVKIGSQSLLSNFSRSPFIIDGVEFQSVEGFIQALKFPPNSTVRLELQGLVGREAKMLGKLMWEQMVNAINGTHSYILEWNGEKFPFRSPEHIDLMKRAMAEKFWQNADARDELLATNNDYLELAHKESPFSSLYLDEFSETIMKIRDELRS